MTDYVAFLTRPLPDKDPEHAVSVMLDGWMSIGQHRYASRVLTVTVGTIAVAGARIRLARLFCTT